MSLAGLETPALARALAAVAERADDRIEAFFERTEEVELAAEGAPSRARRRREEGLAIRLRRDRRLYLASSDAITGAAFGDALRRVARSLPSALFVPEIAPIGAAGDSAAASAAFDPGVDSPAAFRDAVESVLRRRWVAFPFTLRLRRLERETRVVGPRWSGPAERERFVSVEATTPWGRVGLLAAGFDEALAETLAGALADRFRARDASPPSRGPAALLLAPAATAVLLHEAVAHALEADLLAATGRAEAAIGVRLGGDGLSVLEDPAAAPPGVARSVDDEGTPVLRRWLVRSGVVEQPLADLASAAGSDRLLAGCGFASTRHAPPRARTHHLELLAGEASPDELAAAADGGWEIGEISGGRLDPQTGLASFAVPCARRIGSGAAGEVCGPFRLTARVAALLGAIAAIGGTRASSGAGWCAKAGERRAVWATAPAVVLAGLELAP